MPTGIAGFDEITSGGLPRNRTTLLMGGPGCGKTVFALQTLVNGNKYTRKALLTALYGANMAFSVYQKYWESFNFKIFPGT